MGLEPPPAREFEKARSNETGWCNLSHSRTNATEKGISGEQMPSVGCNSGGMIPNDDLNCEFLLFLLGGETRLGVFASSVSPLQMKNFESARRIGRILG